MSAGTWGLTDLGIKAHMMHQGSSLCGAPVTSSLLETPPDDDRCQNCDKRLREMGRAKKPKPKAEAKSNKAVYRPRHTFRDWEEERR